MRKGEVRFKKSTLAITRKSKTEILLRHAKVLSTLIMTGSESVCTAYSLNYLQQRICWADDHNLPLIDIIVIDQTSRKALNRVLIEFCDQIQTNQYFWTPPPQRTSQNAEELPLRTRTERSSGLLMDLTFHREENPLSNSDILNTRSLTCNWYNLLTTQNFYK